MSFEKYTYYIWGFYLSQKEMEEFGIHPHKEPWLQYFQGAPKAVYSFIYGECQDYVYFGYKIWGNGGGSGPCKNDPTRITWDEYKARAWTRDIMEIWKDTVSPELLDKRFGYYFTEVET